jgi:serine protease Do
VNTAIFSPSGGSVGIGFAIPANTVDNVVDSLEHGGVVNRGYLGVQIQPVSQEIAEGLGLKTASGALVDEATPGTPAAKAGLKSGDVIIKLNGEEVKDASDLTRHVGALKPGDKVELTYLRDGAEKTAEITLASQKSEQTAKVETAPSESPLKLGLQLSPASGQQGVAIVNVDPDGLAASKGLASGDVIMQVAGKPVSTPGEVKADIAKAKQEGKKSVLMLVKTADATLFVAFEFSQA